MPEGTLGLLPLSETRGPRSALEEKLAGKNGAMWLTALNRFLRKENPWLSSVMWLPVDENTIEVNLDAVATLPFDHARAERLKEPGNLGWVKVEVIGEDVFVGGRRVILHVEPGQKTRDRHISLYLTEALEKMDVLHPNVLEGLFEANLLPESWKKQEVDGSGAAQSHHAVRIYAWGVRFRDPLGSRGFYVRCVSWKEEQWEWDYSNFRGSWRAYEKAAVLERLK